MFVIETQHKRIPKLWIALVILLGLPLAIAGSAGANLTFTMRKFIDNPAIINAVSSLDVLFNLLSIFSPFRGFWSPRDLVHWTGC